MLFVRVLLIFLSLSLVSSCIHYPTKVLFGYLKKKALECDDIQDIYYFPNEIYNPEFFSKAVICPYTLNPINQNIQTFYIRRDLYDEYAKEYTGLGLDFPYAPKRSGKEGVLFKGEKYYK